ncbi:MAG: hypothetical protein ABR912_10215 [Terracidiphilus sp.]
MNQEVQRPVFIRCDCIQEVIASAKIAKGAFIGPQMIGNSILSPQVQILHIHCRAHQPHSASAIGNGKTPPIPLAGAHGRARREWRFARTGIGQKDNLIRIQIMGHP